MNIIGATVFADAYVAAVKWRSSLWCGGVVAEQEVSESPQRPPALLFCPFLSFGMETKADLEPTGF